MNQILLDTNIVLDIALERREFGAQAKLLMQFLIKKKIEPFVTASSVTDIYYVLRKALGHNEAIAYLVNLVKLVYVATVDSDIILSALNSKLSDFEDAVQTETAFYSNIETIITRDKKDYENSGLFVFSPEEFMNQKLQ